MTPADVRAARRKLGLTQSAMSDLFDRGIRSIQWWEQDDAPEKQRIPHDAALLLRYMLRYGLPDEALKRQRK